MSKSNFRMDNMTIQETNFEFLNQKDFYRGKVRDVYWIEDQLVAIASDRISAFDHILPRAIPYKGQVLNQIAVHFLEATRHAVPNWFDASPDPNVSIGKACIPLRIEMVIRGYLAGHAWRVYKQGGREICGVKLEDGLKESDKLTEAIITPAVKAEEGHDEDISRQDIIEKGIISEAYYHQMESYTQRLFEIGSEMALKQGLILVDTKYEFGVYEGNVLLIDEIHTPDSSRYYYAEGYEERQAKGEKQKQLSKEFVREWLMANGFQGKEAQQMPDMPDKFVMHVSERYIELFEKLTGRKFEKSASENIQDRIFQNVQSYFLDKR
jgi:phosphoribosylaminoimidazole-succinocarboxamide synthase